MEIVELKAEMDKCFEWVDKCLEAIDKRFEDVDNVLGQLTKQIADEGEKTRRHFDIAFEQMKAERTQA